MFSNRDRPTLRLNQLQKYAVLRLLGQGTVSTVYMAEDTTVPVDPRVRCIAIKRFNVDNEDPGRQEGVILEMLKGSEYIVDCYGAFRIQDSYVLALQLLDCSRQLRLDSVPTSFSRGDQAYASSTYGQGYKIIAKIALQMLRAIRDINAKGLLHGDIKPGNVMFEYGHQHKIRLIDFGNAALLSHLDAYHGDYEIQSMGYRAPEVLLGDQSFNEKIDLWSTGVVLLELYVNTQYQGHEQEYRLINSPQRSDAVCQIITSIGSVDCYRKAKFWQPLYEFENHRENMAPLWPSLKDHNGGTHDQLLLVDFLQALLQPDHTKRPSVDKLLNHPFLTQLLN
uniref:ARAD1C17072p n=1 Tax=Blastobotrys adeninivorans TaxID=409370 RepID=A0A060T123_BLAAD